MAETKLVLDLDYMHNLAMKIKASRSDSFVHDGLSYALRFYDIVNFVFNYERSFLRARVTEEGRGFSSTSEIYYPPRHLTRVGRVNEKGNPVLYLSLTVDVALAEIGAKEGDIVQISAFRPKDKPVRVGIIGEKYKASRGSGSFLTGELVEIVSNLVTKMEKEDRKKAMAYLYPDMFFDEIITNPRAYENEYIHSRILAKLIFEKQKTLDGILYHSVASYGGINVALPSYKADSLLGLEYTFLVKIKKAYSYGLFDIEIIGRPKNILKNGSVIW
ncbi:RES domain-containing protein [Serratia sp. D1N4]